jgi:hypothetical protein
MDTLVAPQRTRLRTPAWLLTLSPLGFVVVVAAGAATFVASGIDDTARMTPAQMADIRTAWMLFWPVYAAAVGVGAAGLILLGRALPGGLAKATQVAAGLSVVSILGNVVLNWSMLGFDQPELGRHPGYDTSIFLSILAIWLGAVGAGLAGLALRRAGILRRTGIVVAIVAAVHVVVEATLTQGAIPPFVVSFLWLALGIGLLRRRVPSSS